MNKLSTSTSDPDRGRRDVRSRVAERKENRLRDLLSRSGSLHGTAGAMRSKRPGSPVDKA